MSGISTQKQEIDAQGKIRHVFTINRPSDKDLQMQSSIVNLISSRFRKRKRRKKRPISSRLRKSRHEKLNFEMSNFDEIVTEKGGSTPYLREGSPKTKRSPSRNQCN